VQLLSKDDRQPTTKYAPGNPFLVELTIEKDDTPGMSLELFLTDATRTRLGHASTYQLHGHTLPTAKGTYRTVLQLDPLWLAAGSYGFDVATSVPNVHWDHTVESALHFTVEFSNPLGYPWDFKQADGYGSIALLCHPEGETSYLDSTSLIWRPV
jgi:lipopolysaccharide transport system ATP-binding protein